MQKNEEGRSARVAVIKKVIIAFLIFGIILPLLLCVLLFIKVEQLQRQVNELSARKQEGQVQTVALSGDDVSSQKTETETHVVEETAAADPDWNESEKHMTISEEALSNREMQQSERREGTTRVYLTFDDGPSVNTDEILDILKQYDVKATFFVNGRTQDIYLPMYRRIVEEGHTLGMHSYSHRYNEIYSSVEAFSGDMEKLQEFLYDTTGVWSRFYRFPGGSSNQVSRVPMHELANYLEGENIYYLDWNVSCGDATGKRLKPQQIADNVTDYVSNYNTAVVLLHDAPDKTATVEALPLIIEELQRMEHVEILPVSDEMNMVQHLQQEQED